MVVNTTSEVMNWNKYSRYSLLSTKQQHAVISRPSVNKRRASFSVCLFRDVTCSCGFQRFEDDDLTFNTLKGYLDLNFKRKQHNKVFDMTPLTLSSPPVTLLTFVQHKSVNNQIEIKMLPLMTLHCIFSIKPV